MKPRLGFLRSREFIMKDLYTFDTNLDNAQYTYDLVCESYNNIFKQIGIKYEKGVQITYFYFIHISNLWNLHNLYVKFKKSMTN